MTKAEQNVGSGTRGGGRHRRLGKLRTPVVGVMAVALGSLVLAACSSASGGSTSASGKSSHKTIVVGADFALTGAYSLLGKPDDAGVNVAAKWLNAHGGTDGIHYKVISENDQSTASVAATEAKTLITQDHVTVLIGPAETSEMAAVAEVAAAYKVIDVVIPPVQTWPPSQPKLTSSETKYLFPELGGFYSGSAQAYDSAVWKPKGYTKIALLTDSTPFGLSMPPVFKSLAKKDGLTIVGEQQFAAGATDVTPQVQSLLSDHPQFLFSWTTPGPDTIAAVKAIRGLTPTIPVGIGGGQDTPPTVSALGADANNLYALASISQPTVIKALPSTDPSKKVAEQFTKVATQYNVTTDAGANTTYQGWDGMYLLENAIKKAGGDTLSKLLSAFQHQNLAALSNVWARTPSNGGKYTLAPGYVVQYNGSTWKYIGAYLGKYGK